MHAHTNLRHTPTHAHTHILTHAYISQTHTCTHAYISQTHTCTHTQKLFYRMEVGGSECCREGEKGVMYYKKPGVDERWKLSAIADIAAARVRQK